MEWMKAGRKPRKPAVKEVPAKQEPVLEEDDIDDLPHRKELLFFRSPEAALAAAVIKQWRDDGRPEADHEVIEGWKGILREELRRAAYKQRDIGVGYDD